MRGICKAYAREHGNTLKKPADMTTVRFRGHGATISAGRRACRPPSASEQHVHLIALGFVEHLTVNEETA